MTSYCLPICYFFMFLLRFRYWIFVFTTRKKWWIILGKIDFIIKHQLQRVLYKTPLNLCHFSMYNVNWRNITCNTLNNLTFDQFTFISISFYNSILNIKGRYEILISVYVGQCFLFVFLFTTRNKFTSFIKMCLKFIENYLHEIQNMNFILVVFYLNTLVLFLKTINRHLNDLNVSIAL